jgi:transposase
MQLPPSDVERLDALFRSTTDRKRRDRWLHACCDPDPDGLRPKKAKGKPGKLSASLTPEVRRWVIEGPVQQGLDRANWTPERLAEHLHQTHGVRTPRSAVQRSCAEGGIHLYRQPYRHERGNPQKQAPAQEGLADLGKG